MPDTTSLVYTDGFDYYTDLTTKWTSLSTYYCNMDILTPGRFGYGQRVNIAPQNTQFSAGTLAKAFPLGPYNRLVMGCAVRYNNTSFDTAGGTGTFLNFIDTTENICSISFQSFGRLAFTYGTTTIYTPLLSWAFNAWFYLELDVVFTGSTAGWAMRINGEQVASANTFTGAEAYGISLTCMPNNTSVDYDDIYVLAPTSMTVGDNFLGDIKIVPLIPNASGNLTQWTQTGGVSGQNFTSVDDVPPDGDNSYVASNVAGQIDTYGVPALNSITPVSDVYGVSVYALARKDDSPARFLSVGVGDGTNESFDAGNAVGSTYSYVQRVLPVNPLTGSAWQLNDFENLQLGIKIIS
jgi:hypothetical protein